MRIMLKVSNVAILFFIYYQASVYAFSEEGSGIDEEIFLSPNSNEQLDNFKNSSVLEDELLTNVIEKTCFDQQASFGLSTNLRNYILHFHNSKRSRLALALELNHEGLMQGGKNIYEMSWDMKLENLAHKHISNCSSFFMEASILQSRAQLLKTFWLLWDTGDDFEHIRSALNEWWNQGRLSGNDDYLNRYFNRKNYLGWANMAKGKTTRVGCSYAKCAQEQKAVFLCLYNEKAQTEFEMIYEPGQPCLENYECSTFANSKCNSSSGLCIAPTYIEDDGKNTMCKNNNSEMTDVLRSVALEQHNFYRSRLARGMEFNGETNTTQPRAKNMLKMAYNCELEEYAQMHAEKCVFAHSNGWERPNQGQNLYMTSAVFFDPRALLRTGIEKWWQELELFGIAADNMLTNDMWRRKGKLVGHWTQMAWDRTYHLGCAVVHCPQMGFLVCHYGPAGNRRNQVIYEMGSPCENDVECPKGFHCLAEEGLCALDNDSQE